MTVSPTWGVEWRAKKCMKGKGHRQSSPRLDHRKEEVVSLTLPRVRVLSWDLPESSFMLDFGEIRDQGSGQGACCWFRLYHCLWLKSLSYSPSAFRSPAPSGDRYLRESSPDQGQGDRVLPVYEPKRQASGEGEW